MIANLEMLSKLVIAGRFCEYLCGKRADGGPPRSRAAEASLSALAKGNVRGALTFQIAKGIALADDDSGVTVCLTGSPRGWLAGESSTR